MYAPPPPRGTLALLTSLTLLAGLGCGGPTAPETAESHEATATRDATEVSETRATEGAEIMPQTDACDEASIRLVGHYSLTRYPGQDVVGPNGERPMGMSKEYDFGADSYTMEGYPPLRITGRYEELSRDGARLEVRFYDTVFDGQPDEDRVLWLVFEDCGQTLQMDGMTYARQPAP
jgi:hypothetical protein